MCILWLVCTQEQRCMRRPEVLDSQDLELLAGVGCLIGDGN